MKHFCRDRSVSLLRRTLAANACTASFADPRGTVQSMSIVCKAMPSFANRTAGSRRAAHPALSGDQGFTSPYIDAIAAAFPQSGIENRRPHGGVGRLCKSGNASSREKCPLMAACDGFAKNQPLMRLQNRPSLPRAFAKAS